MLYLSIKFRKAETPILRNLYVLGEFLKCFLNNTLKPDIQKCWSIMTMLIGKMVIKRFFTDKVSYVKKFQDIW